jgi:hypothetical protein
MIHKELHKEGKEWEQDETAKHCQDGTVHVPKYTTLLNISLI